MTAAVCRLIAHLDMDAFYASVELLRYPELRGCAVVIGGGRRHEPVECIDAATGTIARQFATLRGYTGRGVITTATYEARALGLASAMSMQRAAKLAPDTILLPVDFDAYRSCSRRFKAAVREIAPQVEDRGIDEIYIDLTDAVPASQSPTPPAAERWDEARAVAQSIKDAVREATSLTCSIAVAPNKLLAKIASELDKPDGLTILRPDDLPARIWPLPVRRVNGIGPKAGVRLHALGIRTIGELAAAEPAWLVAHFGASYGAMLHDAAHGRDDRPVVTHHEPKSVSRELTFERDLSARDDRELLRSAFERLCEGVAGDLARKHYVARTLGIKLRYDNFKTVSRDRTIEQATQDARTIRAVAGECLRRVPLDRRIRLLGVRAGALAPADAPDPPTAVPASLSLFESRES